MVVKEFKQVAGHFGKYAKRLETDYFKYSVHTYILLKHRPNSTIFLVCVCVRVVKAPQLASAVPLLVSTKATGLNVNMVPSDTEEDNTEDEASTASSAQEAPAVPKTPSPVNNDMPADSEARAGLTAGGLTVLI